VVCRCTHDFGSDQTGSVSVYVNNQLPYGIAADLEIHQANGGWANIQGAGPQGGPGFGPNGYNSRVCSSPSDTALLCSTGLFFSGSPNWHKFEIDVNSLGVTVKVDDTTLVTSSSVTTFRTVGLATWGAPSGASAYYDDFSATVTPPGPLYNVCLLYDPTKAVKSGATIPIKLQLCDASGNDLSSAAITAHATSINQVSTTISGDVEDAGNANPDNDFRFDATLGPTGGYIFNLKTIGLTTGTYNLNFTVTGDSFVYAAPFQVK
jgi:hypothetical protein